MGGGECLHQTHKPICINIPPILPKQQSPGYSHPLQPIPPAFAPAGHLKPSRLNYPRLIIPKVLYPTLSLPRASNPETFIETKYLSILLKPISL